MCTKYKVCGNRHRRDKKGRFVSYRPLVRAFLVGVGVYAVSMIGGNTIWNGLKSLEKTFEVENVQAVETIYFTWQDEVKSTLRAYEIDVDYASKVIQCESGWNPKAFNYNRNGSIDRGLWQINSIHGVDKETLYDPYLSTLEAIKIINRDGWKAWVCVSKGLIK